LGIKVPWQMPITGERIIGFAVGVDPTVDSPAAASFASAIRHLPRWTPFSAA
jgi:hypothetical protein